VRADKRKQTNKQERNKKGKGKNHIYKDIGTFNSKTTKHKKGREESKTKTKLKKKKKKMERKGKERKGKKKEQFQPI